MKNHNIRLGLFSGIILALAVSSGVRAADATQSSAYPPPPGPYQSVPPVMLNGDASPDFAYQGDRGEQLRKRYEERVKQRKEAMQEHRQEMIKRYQAMRDQGFHAEREDTSKAEEAAANPAVPAWVEERHKQQQALREKNEAERQVRIKDFEAAREQAKQRAKQQAEAMAKMPAAGGPVWRPMPIYPPRYPQYTVQPYRPGMGWRPPPPPWMRQYPAAPNAGVNPGGFIPGAMPDYMRGPMPGHTSSGNTKPSETTSGVTNPGVTNPGVTNPGVTNPGVTTPGNTKQEGGIN